MDEYSYYMIRVGHPRAEGRPESGPESRPEQLAGVVERLATGEKRSFADCDELLRMLNGWSNAPTNMRPVTGRGKARSTQSHP